MLVFTIIAASCLFLTGVITGMALAYALLVLD